MARAAFAVSSYDVCGLQRRWSIAPIVAQALLAMEEVARRDFAAQGLPWPGLYVISGYRSREHQAQVNPAVLSSFHTTCPALAVDLRVGDLPASTTAEFWPYLGQIWKSLGGTWGGTFDDPNHFDFGIR
jgi:hypothetical protein